MHRAPRRTTARECSPREERCRVTTTWCSSTSISQRDPSNGSRACNLSADEPARMHPVGGTDHRVSRRVLTKGLTPSSECGGHQVSSASELIRVRRGGRGEVRRLVPWHTEREGGEGRRLRVGTCPPPTHTPLSLLPLAQRSHLRSSAMRTTSSHAPQQH